MKESPILMSGPLVRATIEDGKTQTRRLLGFDVLPPVHRWECVDGVWHARGLTEAVERQFCTTWPKPHRCRYGVPGDRLWVREAWAEGDSGYNRETDSECVTVIYKATNDVRPYGVSCADFGASRTFDCSEATAEKFKKAVEYMEQYGDRWRPSIHMPRWASRLTLEITAVRVERLQEISEADALAEGVDPHYRSVFGSTKWRSKEANARQAFTDLWNEINGKRAAWAKNPWVWVIEYRRLAHA